MDGATDQPPASLAESGSEAGGADKTPPSDAGQGPGGGAPFPGGPGGVPHIGPGGPPPGPGAPPPGAGQWGPPPGPGGYPHGPGGPPGPGGPGGYPPGPNWAPPGGHPSEPAGPGAGYPPSGAGGYPPTGYGPPGPGGHGQPGGPGYGPPGPGYGPPGPGHGPPGPGYGPPGPGYGPPGPGHGPPGPGYGPPGPGYGPPGPGYGPPGPGYGPPGPGYAPPGPGGYGGPYGPHAQLGPGGGSVMFHAGGPADGSVPSDQAWQPGQGTPHKWDNLPNKPLDDDPNRAPPQYPPPPLPPGMQRFAGYEGMGGFGQFVPLPAPPSLPPPPGEPPKMEFDEVANLSEDQCREAMVAFVAEQCCYGKGCARDHNIKKIQPSTALHYTLETYCEGRSTGYKYEPFRGGAVDGPENGEPPLPWELPCNADELFKDQAKLIEVPHTAEVQMCHGCDGRGFNRCWRCHGLGRVKCSHCHGDGRIQRHDPERGHYETACTLCGGDGWRRCITCTGDGRVRCQECEGYRQIKCFIQLTVTFTNHQSDYILEETDMPDQLVRTVGGTTVFEQALPQVWPIVAYHVQDVNTNSQRLVEEHRVGFSNERQLHQRQMLRAVPVTEVHYTWKDTDSRYWVYGRERRIFCPDYPQNCCWGCQIL